MEANKIYDQLKNDFISSGITDLKWALKMPNLDKYLDVDFKLSGMGLMCDFTNDVQIVYTTVFLSERVLIKILKDNVTNALIFSHHPANWGIEHHNGNYAADEELIAKLKERNISIYVLHHPLDNYGNYSTCKTLADYLHINIEEPAFLYCGALCGVVGTTDCTSALELQELYSQTVGHKTSLYLYGEENLQGEKVAICPGGGNTMFVLEEMMDRKIKHLITGVTIVNEYSKAVHKIEKESGTNVFGGTHYSSEKFAPIQMCNYFHNLGIPSEFVDDEPDLYDL